MLEDVREVAVQRDQHARFSAGGCEQSSVGHPCELFVTGQRHVVASLTKDGTDGVGDVLVKLERSHRYLAGTGTMRSRANSAA